MERCAASAPTAADACRQTIELANALDREAVASSEPQSVELKTRVETLLKAVAQPHCGALEARARFLLALRMVDEAPDNAAGITALLEVATLHPDSHVAGEAVETLFQYREDAAAAGLNLKSLLAQLYEAHKVRRVAGHALFYYAALEALEPQGEEASLRTLLKIIDFHHSSPLWDDALFLAADTLARLGFRGDETRLLEESLLPNPARGIDAMHDGFAQRVRLRLAQRYLAQGRYEEALYQLDLVVNKGSGLKWKDDALWLAARVFAKAGDIPRSCSTIRALLESCPWSKYVQAARKMVHCAP